MKMYTIRSISKDGVYYLCNHWGQRRELWIKFIPYDSYFLFKTKASAKASLSKLFKIFPEYMTDTFDLIEVKIG